MFDHTQPDVVRGHGQPYPGQIAVVRSADRDTILTLTLDTALFTCPCQAYAVLAVLSEPLSIPGVKSAVWTDPIQDTTVTYTVTVDDPAQREEIAELITTLAHGILGHTYGERNTAKIVALPLLMPLDAGQQAKLRERLTALPGVHIVAFGYDVDITMAAFMGSKPGVSMFVYLFGVAEELDNEELTVTLVAFVMETLRSLAGA